MAPLSQTLDPTCSIAALFLQVGFFSVDLIFANLEIFKKSGWFFGEVLFTIHVDFVGRGDAGRAAAAEIRSKGPGD